MTTSDTAISQPLAQEPGSPMTAERALSLYASASIWLRGELNRGSKCLCGHCHLCAYRYLERELLETSAP